MIRKTMQWIGERLTMKVLHLVAAKIESAIEMEIADARGEMLEYVRQLQEGHGDTIVTATMRLQQASENLGDFALVTETDGARPKTTPNQEPKGNSPKPGRGRPRKEPASSLKVSFGGLTSGSAESGQEVSS